jgi:hypothetical protein
MGYLKDALDFFLMSEYNPRFKYLRFIDYNDKSIDIDGTKHYQKNKERHQSSQSTNQKDTQ